MANKSLHNFTVQEASNLDAYTDYYFKEVDLGSTFATVFLDSDAGAPAKQVILTSSGAAVLTTTDVISIVLNNEDDTDATKVIKVQAGGFPFTIENMIITKVEILTSDDTLNETIGCLAFL